MTTHNTILLAARVTRQAFSGLCFLLAMACTARAQFVINNPSFESPALTPAGFTYNLQGWTDVTSGSQTNARFVEYITGFAADGNQHLGMAQGWSVWQDLGVNYQADQVYRLRVAVGNRSGWTDPNNNSMFELLAGDNSSLTHPIGTYNASSLPAGSFSVRELLLDTYDYPALVGHSIRIKLTAGGNSRSHFDYVRLDSNIILVVNTNDSGPGSLRQAVLNAGTFVFPETIRFDPSLSGQTITLTSGQILINKRLTIDASALPRGLTVSGNGARRIFQVAPGPNVSLDLHGLTLTQGRSQGSDDAFFGGAILVSHLGYLRLYGCTLVGNSARYGGAIAAHTDATVILNSCTLTGNSAERGGALYNESQYEPILKDCTIAGNTAPDDGGGGFYGFNYGVSVDNCIVAGNAPDDLKLRSASGSVTRVGVNIIQSLVGSSSGPAAITNAPHLAPLGNYGGPTPTLPPLPGSPAINAGVSSTLPTDQRGFPRLVGGAVDIGAVESGNPLPGFLPIVNTLADFVDGLDSTNVSLREAIAFAPGGSGITFDPALSGQTITLTNGELVIGRNLTVDASALPGGITVSGNAVSRVFSVATGVTAVLNSLKVTAGKGTGNGLGGGIYNQGTLTVSHASISANTARADASDPDGTHPGYGAGIYNTGTLNVNNSTVSSNSVAIGGRGGGIYNAGMLTLNDSALLGNSGSVGGGIYNAGVLTLGNTILSANDGGFSGGGIENRGTVTADNTTISSNSAGYGGGISAELGIGSPLTKLNNCTLVGNSASVSGGGLHLRVGRIELVHCTISGNMATTSAGGVAIYPRDYNFNDNQFIVQGTIIAGNTNVDVHLFQFTGTGITSLGHNLIGTGSGGSLSFFTQPGT